MVYHLWKVISMNHCSYILALSLPASTEGRPNEFFAVNFRQPVITSYNKGLQIMYINLGLALGHLVYQNFF